MKTIDLTKSLGCVLLMVAFGGTVVNSTAQTNPAAGAPVKPAQTPTAAEQTPSVERKARALPYRGKLVSVDKQRRAITVGTRVFHLGAKTKVESGGKPATLADGVPGQIVTGSYKKLPDGTLEAVSVYFGGKTGANTSGQKKAGSSGARQEKQ